DIAKLIQQTVQSNGYNVVREFVGHGVGKGWFEEPKVPNFYDGSTLRGDFKLRQGMTLTVEPIVLSGGREIHVMPDGWTVVTRDGTPAAHARHTIAITEAGADVLTKLPAT
ncbi:MAG TPA: M24 family metallopeptidase, partial [Chloroflexota bacterium]|nr:M24 family metallopeptidase [Chloroflexota bacterium]